MILWELMTNQNQNVYTRVWQKETLSSQIAKKVCQGIRPPTNGFLNTRWKAALVPIVASSWAGKSEKRMTALEISKILPSVMKQTILNDGTSSKE